MLFVQNLLRNERGNLNCEPYIQTQSRQVSRKEDSISVKCTVNAIATLQAFCDLLSLHVILFQLSEFACRTQMARSQPTSHLSDKRCSCEDGNQSDDKPISPCCTILPIFHYHECS